MKLKHQYWILSLLLIAVLAAVAGKVFLAEPFSFGMFAAVEALIAVTAVFLAVFYFRIIKPLHIIGSGMDLLREQDFGSRLRRVGQPEADRIVEIFNRMMEQLKNERLHLREQNHFLDLLINASPLGVVILDPDGLILSANPAAYRLLGLPPADGLAGRPLDAIGNPLISELLKIETGRSQTVRLSDANIYKCTRSAFIDKGFRHPFYLVELLTEEVFKAEMKAYEKVIRMIAHEVNNTTAGITSTLDTLSSALSEESDEVAEVLRIAIERCYSMNRFITNFADVVRIPEPEPRPLDLNAWLASVKRFIESICRDRNIRIVMELSATPPVVEIDGALFEQALVNIVKNAAESIGHDGGDIFIRTCSTPSRLEIADTGRGIDRNTESRLFSPFFSTKPHGQGLGLIFIREVLLKHHCTFSLRTCPDGLTRFSILFADRPAH
ncbi:MAG: PAS domain-containing protein [Tannerella sp.]|jgi:nitrogen fixation/metabolism regulation signal transduction histidine kinase|nr:PAS domain-containing protein [Tannerella sp.]